ncbi:MAG: DUF167 domain-containing protein [Proteobacteria bacterium]|nr:DUF167 domain-containing protein [Pseudomonadota bacterium]MCL2306639.1 DUF167 domain-containing protein [Pseudomonadota bacterium]
MDEQAASWRRQDGSDWVLTLHVQPGAKRTEIQGLHDGALKVRLAAPPVEGKANQALRRFLAEAFGVGLRAVTLEHGQNSRHKIVRVAAPTKWPDGF